MSEGQNAVLYLGSVTVQERRIETDAYDIEKVLEQQEKTGQADRTALAAAIKKAILTTKTGKEELEKINVPESAKTIHELYKQLFDANERQLGLAQQILDAKDQNDGAKARRDLAEVRSEITGLSRQILDEKRKLSAAYQEVQLPEASPSTAHPAASADR